MKDQELYQAIIDRATVRQFEQAALTQDSVDQLNAFIAMSKPLVPDNHVAFLQLHEINPVDLLVAQGPYGTFVVSPHVLLPYTTSQQFPLLEVGYQAQQVVIHLFKAGIGSCYLGTAGRETSVIRHFGLPVNSVMGASLVIGYPKDSDFRSVANFFRKPGNPTKRLAMEELFFLDEFGNTGTMPEALSLVMTAAQRAPSATNAQPWRFVRKGDWLYLYVLPRVYPFVLSQRNRNTYALHDAGLVMANISLAYQALGEERNWVLYDFAEASFPEFPKEVLPVGKIAIN